MAITQVLVDENHIFTAEQEWQREELRRFILNSESLYLQLVSLCNQAMSKIKNGKYDEAQHLGVIVDTLIDRAIKEYKTLDKTNSMKAKMIPAVVRFRVALDLFNEVMTDLGFTHQLEKDTIDTFKKNLSIIEGLVQNGNGNQ